MFFIMSFITAWYVCRKMKPLSEMDYWHTYAIKVEALKSIGVVSPQQPEAYGVYLWKNRIARFCVILGLIIAFQHVGAELERNRVTVQPAEAGYSSAQARQNTGAVRRIP